MVMGLGMLSALRDAARPRPEPPPGFFSKVFQNLRLSSAAGGGEG
jgi:hypothetical protein